MGLANPICMGCRSVCLTPSHQVETKVTLMNLRPLTRRHPTEGVDAPDSTRIKSSFSQAHDDRGRDRPNPNRSAVSSTPNIITRGTSVVKVIQTPTLPSWRPSEHKFPICLMSWRTFPGDWKVTGSHLRMTNGSVTVCVSTVFDDQPRHVLQIRRDCQWCQQVHLVPVDEVPRTIRTLIEDYPSPFARLWRMVRDIPHGQSKRYRNSTAGMIRDMERDIGYHRERLKAYDEILSKLGWTVTPKTPLIIVDTRDNGVDETQRRYALGYRRRHNQHRRSRIWQ